jgi:hypothetical protein
VPAVTRPQQAQHHSDRLLGLAEAANGTATTSPAVHAVVVAYAGAPYRETLNRIQVTFNGTLTNCGRPHVGGRVLDVAVGSNRTVGGIRLDCGKYGYPRGAGSRLRACSPEAPGVNGAYKQVATRPVSVDLTWGRLGGIGTRARGKPAGKVTWCALARGGLPGGAGLAFLEEVVWNQVVRG